MSDEESRAADWRAQQVRRAQSIRDNEKRLRGSPTTRRTLEQQWSPVINRTRTEDSR